MNRRTKARLWPLAALLAASAALADPATKVQNEVSFLLGYIEGSGCEFQRNGDWHSAREAQAHLRDKYRAMVARDLVATTEQFIEGAASRSSVSGQPYLIRCAGGTPVPSRQWLQDELTRLRSYP